MKLRITQKQLNELDSEQKQNLCDLWIPNLYDTAVATVCIDAAEEKYGQITYVIGGITILKNNNLHLFDLKYLPEEKIKILSEEDDDLENNYSENDAESVEDNEKQDIEESENDEEVASEDDEDFFGEDFSFEFQRPESYIKQECLPLLNIGQMIEILSKKNYGKCNFSLSVETEENYIEMGKENFISNNTFNENSENAELCDILWEAIKAVL